ncbi:AEC family transporter [Poseidonibacter ostreae]|jgi:malate permease and related proteins|uniref:Transporter n=1 Tax=Poseidonibacter ostreae TaxID=2654171 RepID=A0A6L4WTS2_9BACT|nr:AEC family transporter [Poseidonibacter ostreae]KAB7886024.1 transporter [Poseidonibacter ostreae]KAB7889476.1 transporter [Poseidonibacter ostreae]KAB7892509.1 transporter [Poseidonibacter ostreae]
MNLFLILLSKISPLYLNIILGYILTKYLKVRRDYVAFILIYILGPVVIFFATLSININFQLLFLPLFVFIFGSSIAFFILYKYKNEWKDASINTLAFTCGTGNTGYFGIPLAMILLSPENANMFIFATLASLLYENTTGFYVTAKGSFTARQSIIKIIKLPLLYAFIAGLTLNVIGVDIPSFVVPYFEVIKWVFGILGMMMLGMGMKGFNLEEDMDKKYIKIAYFFKFIFWPASILLIIFMDKSFFGLLNQDIYDVLFLFSIVPLAGNTITLAVLLNAKPQKASFTVLLSNLISIIYIPIMLFLYGGV